MTLDYLHAQDPRVSHRDIKLENALAQSSNGNKPLMKVVDFGLSRTGELADTLYVVGQLLMIRDCGTLELSGHFAFQHCKLHSAHRTCCQAVPPLLQPGTTSTTLQPPGGSAVQTRTVTVSCLFVALFHYVISQSQQHSCFAGHTGLHGA